MREFQNKIICGDCIKVLSEVRRPFADLIFADPPFNIGYQYDEYHDKIEKHEYLDWSEKWIKACLNALKPDGSFYIAIGDDYAAEIKCIAEKLGLFMRNWIIWHYTFGQQTKNKFARSHTHVFYFVNDKENFTFNDHAVRVPSDRQLTYNDKRANSKGKMPDDVWSQYSRVCGTFKERAGWHPCQMPENLLKRIIAASSNAGDCVLDPFVGSGTTATAAYQLGRNYVGFDISEKYVENTRKRLAQLKRQLPTGLPLNLTEANELKQLIIDIKIPARKIAADKKLLRIFTNQFAVRMNNKKQYGTEKIAIALQDISD